MSQSKPCVHPVAELYVCSNGQVRCLLCDQKVSGVSATVQAMLPKRDAADKPADDVRLLPPTTTPDKITPEA